MTIRTRTQTAVGVAGSYYKYFFGSIDQGTVNVPGLTATCTDVAGNYPYDNPLTINKTTYSIRPITVSGGNQFANYVYQDYTPALYRGVNFGHLGLPALSDPADATKVFARSNPSRASVDVPAAVGELRELPALLYKAGKTMLRNGVVKTFKPTYRHADWAALPRGAANTYLAYEYGWKPFLSDLKKLLDFQAQVIRRERELKNLHSKGGLSRTVQISTDRAELIQTGVFVESALFTCYGTNSVTTVRKRWGTAKWLPDHPSLPVTDVELHKQAVQAVYGLSLSPRTAWELIPWSWLIDWASDVGDYLEANRNTVGATCVGANLMTHTKTVHKFYAMTCNLPITAGMGEATIVVETKLRGPFSSPILFSDIPHMDVRKTSILGALGIQRTRGIP